MSRLGDYCEFQQNGPHFRTRKSAGPVLAGRRRIGAVVAIRAPATGLLAAAEVEDRLVVVDRERARQRQPADEQRAPDLRQVVAVNIAFGWYRLARSTKLRNSNHCCTEIRVAAARFVSPIVAVLLRVTLPATNRSSSGSGPSSRTNGPGITTSPAIASTVRPVSLIVSALFGVIASK